MTEKNAEESGAVEVPAVTQLGSTFAERKAAREGAGRKAVDAGEAQVEDKAVKSTRARVKKG